MLEGLAIQKRGRGEKHHRGVPGEEADRSWGKGVVTSKREGAFDPHSEIGDVRSAVPQHSHTVVLASGSERLTHSILRLSRLLTPRKRYPRAHPLATKRATMNNPWLATGLLARLSRATGSSLGEVESYGILCLPSDMDRSPERPQAGLSLCLGTPTRG